MNRDEDLTYLKRAMVDLTDEVCKIAPNLSTDIVRTHLSIYDHQEQTIKELREENASLLVIATDKQAEIESLKIQSNKYARRLCNLGEDKDIVWFSSNEPILD